MIEYRALLIECRALLIKFRALLIECRALLIQLKTFFDRYGEVLRSSFHRILGSSGGIWGFLDKTEGSFDDI